MYEEPDPDGDLLIILTPPSEPFALWDDKPAEAVTQEEPDPESDPEFLDDELVPEPEPLEVRVSSKHMCHASPRFEKMLNGPWLEATTIHPDGLRHVEMEGFDPEAFIILMNIIHLNNDLVPLSIDLDMLAKIAVLVDDLQCQRAVSILANIWIENLHQEFTPYWSRTVILWILISSIFRHRPKFKEATREAILYEVGPMPTLGLPIHNTITRRIELERAAVLNNIMKVLHDTVDELSAGRGGLCDSEGCRMILLGSLVKGMHALSLPLDSRSLSGRGVAPLDSRSLIGRGVARLSHAVKDITNPLWVDKKRRHRCEVEALVSRSIDSHVAAVEGLNIDEVLPNKDEQEDYATWGS